MANLYPYIFSENAKKQADFYAHALKGEVVSVQTFDQAPGSPPEIAEKVMHLTLQVAGQTFFMADAVREPVHKGSNLNLVLEYRSEDEAREAFDGLSEGGKILMPFEKVFWGAMFGRLED